jgi:hypothetical protein
MTYKEAVYHINALERVLGLAVAIIRIRRLARNGLPPVSIVNSALEKMRLDCKTIQGYSCVVIDGVTFKHEIRGD